MIARLDSALSSTPFHRTPLSSRLYCPHLSALITDSALSTLASPCRFVDLPGVRAKGCVGEADTFGSHCWGATWGHLVASLADQADPNRHVWIDIFAVRQWP